MLIFFHIYFLTEQWNVCDGSDDDDGAQSQDIEGSVIDSKWWIIQGSDYSFGQEWETWSWNFYHTLRWFKKCAVSQKRSLSIFHLSLSSI